MGGEVEAAGAAVSAGLVAAAIDPVAGAAGEAHAICPNCGSVLRGRFCQTCGQPAHIHRSLGHLFEEALHGLLHFDAKIWRTLPKLFFRPGTLTHEYVHGKRARFMSPLALFLLTVFLMFFAFAFVRPEFNAGETVSGAAVLERAQQRRDVLSARLAEAQAKLAAAKADAEARRAAGAETQARVREAALAGPEQAVAALRQELAALDAEIAAATAQRAAGDDKPWQVQWNEAIDRGTVDVDIGSEELNAKVLKKLRNPDLMIYKIQQTAYKFSWLLVPLSLPFVALLFLWKRGFTWFDHGVFTLYSLSFVSLLVIGLALVLNAPSAVSQAYAYVFLALPAHMFFHLKGAYRLGWWSAAWRTVALLFFALFALIAFFIGILFIGLLG